MCAYVQVHGSFIGILKQYHSTLPAAASPARTLKHNDEPKPFSLIDYRLTLGISGTWMNRKAYDCQILGSGIILLKNYITHLGMVRLYVFLIIAR